MPNNKWFAIYQHSSDTMYVYATYYIYLQYTCIELRFPHIKRRKRELYRNKNGMLSNIFKWKWNRFSIIFYPFYLHSLSFDVIFKFHYCSRLKFSLWTANWIISIVMSVLCLLNLVIVIVQLVDTIRLCDSGPMKWTSLKWLLIFEYFIFQSKAKQSKAKRSICG